MMNLNFTFLLIFAFFFSACSSPAISQHGDLSLSFVGEKRISNLRQLTFSGKNTKPTWSFDGKSIVFQRESQNGCDQIYEIRVDGSSPHAISSDHGENDHARFSASNQRVLYSSTDPRAQDCSNKTGMEREFQLFTIKRDQSDRIPFEPGAPRAFNGEVSVCEDGKVVFSSNRGGHTELYLGREDSFGTVMDLHRVAVTQGDAREAVFSSDCTKLAWSESSEIWVSDIDGKNRQQLTHLGAKSLTPAFSLDSNKIVFASNLSHPKTDFFALYEIDVNGTGLERVSFSDLDDRDASFSPDGKHLVFSSTRNASRPGETNLFIADWSEQAVLENQFEQPRDHEFDHPVFLGGACKQGHAVVIQGDQQSSRGMLSEISKILNSSPKVESSCYLLSGQPIKKFRTVPKVILNLGSIRQMNSKWKPLLPGLCNLQGLRCVIRESESGVISHPPVLGFYADSLNEPMSAAQWVAGLAERLSAAQQPLEVLERKHETQGGSGAYLGLVPDYSNQGQAEAPSGGVRLLSPHPGSPAEGAAVKEGDVLVAIEWRVKNKFQTEKVGGIQDFEKTLLGLRPGQEVKLIVKRGKKDLELPTTVGREEDSK